MTGESFLGQPSLRGGERVVVAMSGGVDSSVAAAVLVKAGHEVVGVTLRLQDCDQARGSRSCCGVDGIVRARAVAARLGIAHYVLDCVREFEEVVLRPSWDEYAAARTPSPCLRCNEEIKFGLLFERAEDIGARWLATGHYARVTRSVEGESELWRGLDQAKDQTYFLAGLDPRRLAATLFPVGHMDKAEVRAVGRELGLPSAETKESQDACLVGQDQSFAEMLRDRFSAEAQPGAIVDEKGEVLGRHLGIHHFTIGQRRGLGVPSATRLWVKAIRAEGGQVIVTAREEALYSERFTAERIRWLSFPDPGPDPMRCEVQVRYRQAPAKATVALREDGAAEVHLDEPVRAISPGQAAVFYRGSHVLGRGWIGDVRSYLG